MLKTFRTICTIIFLFLVFWSLPFTAQASPLAYNSERIAGENRCATAIKIAQKGWNTAQTVILCELNDYPDSIAAAPFAASLDAPILLTNGKTITPEVKKELQRLKPQKVILLGGKSRLTEKIEQELEASGFNWERIGAENRYATSVLLAKKLNGDSLIIANGDDFPDALSAASYAGALQIPIVLTSKTLPKVVQEYYQEIKPQKIIVIGGETVVPTKSLTECNINITTRLGGKDRYETNAQVVEYMKKALPTESFFLASGLDFPDAVAGTVLAVKFKAPLLLTKQKDIPPPVYHIMRLHMKVEPEFLGGKGKVTATNLNLRDIPNISGRVLTTIPKNTSLIITRSQNQWYETSYQKKKGWVSAEYVQIVETFKQGIVTASGGLNLRKEPSIEATRLETIPQGGRVTILSQHKDWYQVDSQGTIGYVFGQYLDIISNSIDLSPNGKVYILGGTSVISSEVQDIIAGRSRSKDPANQKGFPPLPPSLDAPSPNPGDEKLIDPFVGLPAGILKGKKILIDPGHGGPDPGAIGPSKTYEKHNTLEIAQYLRDILTEAGATVIMTRESDISPAPEYSINADLQARVEIANREKPDLFISIHNDSFTNPAACGTSTFYSLNNPKSAESKKLAEAVQNSVYRALNTNNRGVKQENFYVLRKTLMPAVLVEVAFISNSLEEARLQNPIFRKNAATAIFHGLCDYYGLR
jgi:N-acetylmuramoyl-L-alanine amidase